MALAIINDYVTSRRMKLHLDPEDFKMVDDNWGSEDKLLIDLQKIDIFRNRTRWFDLEPMHYRLMIANNISRAFSEVEGSLVSSETIVKSLSFLICALIRCIELRADCHIEMIRLVRVDEIDLAVEFQASLAMEEDINGPEEVTPATDDGPGLKIVVDNP